MVNHKRGLVLALTAVAGVFSTQVGAAPVKGKAPEHVPGEFLVKLKGEANGLHAQANQVLTHLGQMMGGANVLSVNPLVTDKTIQKIRVSSEQKLMSALSILKQDPAVEYVEPNYIYRISGDAVPNDPDFGKLWGLKNLGQADADGQKGKSGSDINVLPLWNMGITGDRKVLVAVIDTGVDWTHPDLAANLYTNPGEAGDKASNGKDDDGNGFVDDVHGWNFYDNTPNSVDDHGHGSHCSGTIGGEGNNGVGVAGVNWKVSILPVKFLSAEGGGSLEGAVNAINYARMMKVNIMSNSWGGGGFSQALADAIEATKKDGITFVAAAGNDTNNNDTTPSYPASYQIDNIISVAATDNQDKIASFSNYGAKSVHVAAPGVKVYSTVKEGKYDTYSGTSMATPHVSGIAALLLSANPDWTYSTIKERLIKTSDPVAGLRKKVAAKGRVNAFNAYQNIVPPNNGPDESQWRDVDKKLESDHPYKNKENKTWTIKQAGAKYIRVFFEKVDVESGYDKVTVENSKGEVADEISGQFDNYTSDFVAGDTVVIRLTSDNTDTAFGFKIAKIQVIKDRRNAE